MLARYLIGLGVCGVLGATSNMWSWFPSCKMYAEHKEICPLYTEYNNMSYVSKYKYVFSIKVYYAVDLVAMRRYVCVVHILNLFG